MYVMAGNSQVIDKLGLLFIDWIPILTSIKTTIDNLMEAIPGQKIMDYPGQVTCKECYELTPLIAEGKCERTNDEAFHQYVKGFSTDMLKSKAVDLVVLLVGKMVPPLAIAAAVDAFWGAGLWIDVTMEMMTARDDATKENCDCSKTGYIPQAY